MFIVNLARAAAVALAVIVLTAASPAKAEWLKAESERFIVYGDGDARELRALARKLETFDRVLRWRMGLDPAVAPHRKLPIYLVKPSGLRRVRPGIGDNVAGFYAAREEDIFAIALRGGMGDDVLLHEYAHHFMMQNFSDSYPAWFVEGFAEYFMTVEIEDDRILIGKHNDNRGAWLRGASWLSMSDLLAKRSGEIRRNNATYYPLAWLLTHWFMANDDRSRQLQAYLSDVGGGGDTVQALTRATGLTLPELRQELRRYMGRLPYYQIANTFGQAEATITPMPASANDFILMNQRLTGVPTNVSNATLSEVRRLAARHADDPTAMMALGHAEIHLGDRPAGEAVLRRLIEAHPDHVEGLQYLAVSLLERADEDEANAAALKTEARGLLNRAYRIDDANYRTFMLLGRTRVGGPGYPNENDVATRELALQLAPQLARARMDMAETYLAAGRREDAMRTIEPLANNPHGGEEATAARALLDRMRGLTAAEARAEAAAANTVEEEGD